MKHTFHLGVLALALLMSGITLAANGYELARSTVSSGSAVSSGGTYTLDATAGQLNAGQLTGGSYTLVGGFWGGGTTATHDDYKRYLPLIVR